MIGSLPAWPALMNLEYACAYTSLSEAQFKALAARYNVAARDLGGLRGVRWRRADLDRLIDMLPAHGEPSVEVAVVDPAQAALERVHKRAGRRH